MPSSELWEQAQPSWQDARCSFQLCTRRNNEGQIGQCHFGKRRPDGADHEEKRPGLVGLDEVLT